MNDIRRLAAKLPSNQFSIQPLYEPARPRQPLQVSSPDLQRCVTVNVIVHKERSQDGDLIAIALLDTSRNFKKVARDASLRLLRKYLMIVRDFDCCD